MTSILAEIFPIRIHIVLEYASLRTAIINRLHKVNIPIPELKKFKEYGPIIPNSFSLLHKTCKGCKAMYYMLIEKRLIYVLQYQNGVKKVIFFHNQIGIRC